MITMKCFRWICLLPPLLLVGCLKKPEFVAVQNVEIIGIEANALVVELDYVIRNPNYLTAKIETSDIDIFYREKKVGEGSNIGKTILSPEQTLELPFRCRIFLDDLVDDYPKLLSENPSEFRAKGVSKIKILFFHLGIGIEEWIGLDVEDTIKSQISEMLSEKQVFRVKAPPYPHPGLQETTLDIPLEWNNEYSFGYKILGMNLRISLKPNGNPVANWISDETWAIDANDQREIPVEIVVNNMHLLREGGLSMVLNSKIRLYIKGTVSVEIGGNAFELPVDAVTEIDRPSTPSIPANPFGI